MDIDPIPLYVEELYYLIYTKPMHNFFHNSITYSLHNNPSIDRLISLSPMDSILYNTIRSGDINKLKQIIANSHEDILLNQMTPLHNTILHVSVQSSNILSVREICKRCSSLLTKKNSVGDTPLHIAARLGLSDIASLLVEESKRHSMINPAAGRIRGSLSVLQQLVRMENKNKDTALHEAVRNKWFKVVKMLTEADPSFEYFANDAGETPLYLAAEEGLYDFVVQILQTCPSSAHQGPLGRNALYAAVLFLNLNHSVHFIEENLDGKTPSLAPGGPLDSTTLANFASQPKKQPGDSISLLLKKKPCMIKEADDYGCSVLHYAAYYGDVDCVVQLLKVDPSVAYMADKDGETALHIVARVHRRIEVIHQLVRRCPDCWELLNNRGQNFLHVAAENGLSDAFYYANNQSEDHQGIMLKNLINQPDNDGNTPFHLATKTNRKYPNNINIISRDDRVNKRAMNKDNLTAHDNLQNDIEQKDIYRGTAMDKDLSSLPPQSRSFLHGISLLNGNGRKAMIFKEKPVDIDLIRNNTHINEAELEQKQFQAMEKLSESHLVVATLIATVTFAAGFTLPGGLNQDGPYKGMAVLTRRLAFQGFMVSNTMAMILSTFAVFIHFLSKVLALLRGLAGIGAVDRHKNEMLYSLIAKAYFCTFFAIISMVVAFVTGTYTVLHHSPGLAIPLCLFGCSFFLLCCWVLFRIFIFQFRFFRTMISLSWHLLSA